jgi:hypothetical protein
VRKQTDIIRPALGEEGSALYRFPGQKLQLAVKIFGHPSFDPIKNK